MSTEPQAPIPPKTSGLAVVALVLGVLGPAGFIALVIVGASLHTPSSILENLEFGLFLTGIIGLVLGIVSRLQIKESHNRLKGIALAMAGIVIPIVLTLGFIIYVACTTGIQGNNRQAKESTLKANLQQIRSATVQFQADTGLYPARLADLVATTAPTTGAGGLAIPSGTYKGPYLTPRGGIADSGIPQNPFADPSITNINAHWRYTSKDGSVSSAVSGTTVDGVAYTAL